MRSMMVIFRDRYPLLGPVIWILNIQYYVTQVIVAQDWAHPYSWLHNTISDLGNTACGPYGGMYVCSPLHSQMNASFIWLGLTMAIGSLLIYREFYRSTASLIGFSLMAIAGFGTIMVGLFPENTVSQLHVLGAALPFGLGNLALIILGIYLPLPLWLKVYTAMSGTIAFLALPLFLTDTYIGLGIGGTERIVAYPQSIWLIVFGAYMSRNRYRHRARNARR